MSLFKKIILLILILFFLPSISSAIIDRNLRDVKEKTIEKKEGEIPSNFYAIHEINQKKFSFGTYYTSGYVVKKYECPPCPSLANCKPCMANNIVISEKNKRLDDYNRLTENDLIVFVEDIKPFEAGKMYRFLIQITDAKTTSQFINNVKLIYFDVPEGL